MQKWAENIKNVQEGQHMNLVVAANNHYAGFGPGTMNIFRNMIGLPEAKWEEKEMGIQNTNSIGRMPQDEAVITFIAKVVSAGENRYSIIFPKEYSKDGAFDY
jgi:hypothetical protein